MLIAIYPWAFTGTLIGLLSWSLARNFSIGLIFRSLFFIGSLLWILAIIAVPADIIHKAGIIVRDLLVLGIAALAMQWARSNLSSGLLLLLGAGLFLHFGYLETLRASLEPQTPAYAESEILADLADIDAQSLASYAEEQGGQIFRAFKPIDSTITDLDEYYMIDLPGRATVREVKRFISEISKLGLTDWAEPNEIITLTPFESETQGPSTSNSAKLVNDPDVDKQWGFEALDIGELYKTLSLKTVKPVRPALIAILDTGVDGKHEDLKDAYLSTKTEYDIDIQGHGTHVAGIAAAVSNNFKGIASFDPAHEFIRVTSIKVLSDRGMGTQANIINGMIEAADLGADVISMSLGGRSNSEKEIAYENAVKYCNDKGAIVVVAAGNSNANARHYAPAKVAGVIAVSAINSNFERAPFSNSVQDIKYGLAAPGDQIYSTIPNNGYQSFRGTSMACPHVSSVVAIIRSFEPALNTDQVYEILYRTGTESKDGNATGKIINPTAAVRALMD
ncbi:MAG: S8 family serine peptidase [Saprospiraceae bacterium]|nr:S8 family serine peptidase [Saprospiraceae bacterium]